MPEPGEIVAGKYRVLRVLGAGGMGVVFEGVELATQAPVAIKCLHPEIAKLRGAAQRFAREAEALARIRHPNVVTVREFGEHDGQLYLVLERLRGASLRAHMNGRQLALGDACRLLLPVLRGVAAAHAAGVLHRDLKPENIFLAEPAQGAARVPKVLDFGLARLRDQQSLATLGGTSPLLGTYLYMAPEQLRAQSALDERADVYALGAIAFEMLTGELPYRANNPVDLALQILESEAPLATSLVPTLPEDLALALARALARERTLRFPSVADFAGVLATFDVRRPRAPTPASSRTAPPVVRVEPVPASSARRTARAAVAASVLLGVAAAGYALVLQRPAVGAMSTLVHAQDPWTRAAAPARLREDTQPQAAVPAREQASAPIMTPPREEAAHDVAAAAVMAHEQAATAPVREEASTAAMAWARLPPAGSEEPSDRDAKGRGLPRLRGPALRAGARVRGEARSSSARESWVEADGLPERAVARRERMRAGGPSSVLRRSEF